MYHSRKLAAYMLLTGVIVLVFCAVSGAVVVETEVSTAVPEGFEASDLLMVQNPHILGAKNWDYGFWTVSDEKNVEKNLALVGHEKGAPMEKGWCLEFVQVQADFNERTDDAEALCRNNGWVYVIGSHFGKKSGPLKADRQFIARFREENVMIDNGRYSVAMEVRKDGFLLHRLINDALAVIRPDIIQSTEAEQKRFIIDGRREGGKGSREYISLLNENDWPLNIEGADFTLDGSLLVGLRYPVSRSGNPLVVKIKEFENLFTSSKKMPSISCVCIIENIGNVKRLTGIRSLRVQGDRVHIITGAIDSRPEMSLLLQEHPGNEKVDCAHYVFSLPVSTERTVTADCIRTFDKTQDIEGVTLDNRGDAFYVKDLFGKVPVLFTLTH